MHHRVRIARIGGGEMRIVFKRKPEMSDVFVAYTAFAIVRIVAVCIIPFLLGSLDIGEELVDVS